MKKKYYAQFHYDFTLVVEFPTREEWLLVNPDDEDGSAYQEDMDEAAEQVFESLGNSLNLPTGEALRYRDCLKGIDWEYAGRCEASTEVEEEV